jgi:hypothetical protein
MVFHHQGKRNEQQAQKAMGTKIVIFLSFLLFCTGK